MHLLLSLVFVTSTSAAAAADYSNRLARQMTSAQLLAATRSSRPAAGLRDAAFDCAWRELAIAFAPTIVPTLTTAQLGDLMDALELEALHCNATAARTAVAAHAPAPRPTLQLPEAGNSIYVDFARGDDGNAGTEAAPLKTIAAGVAASRAGRPAVPTLVLRGGTHYLAATVDLGAGDSSLTVTAFPAEVPVISGATPLRGLQWKQGSAAAPWAAAVPPGLLPPKAAAAGLSALRINGHRATLARFPNANAELDLFPIGYITAAKWLPPLPNPVQNRTYTVNLGKAADPGKGMYIDYTVGYGGNADRYVDGKSFWASKDFQPGSRWNEMHLRSPSGLDYGASLPRAPYDDLRQAIVHSWREHHWFSWMWAATVQANTTAFNFSAGGHQGGEGCDVAAEWWIEGVREELDAANEYYFDSATSTLFMLPNATDTAPNGAPDDAIDAPWLSTYFNLSGSSSAPVANVSFLGLTFVDGAPTFMDPRGVPSGGDWALERNGVLLFEGTVGAIVAGCNFSRIDGNAVFLSGFNRAAAVTDSAFGLLGQSAIASWGRTNETAPYDGTAGEQPRGTVIARNVAHDVGLIQKQSSFYFQAVTAEVVLEANIVYNIGRAAVNVSSMRASSRKLMQARKSSRVREDELARELPCAQVRAREPRARLFLLPTRPRLLLCAV